MREPDVPPAQIALFNDSLLRCLHQGDFFGRFYDLFIGSSTEVQEKFKHTDFEVQKRTLRSSLYAMYMAVEGDHSAVKHLERIAARHSRQDLDIEPRLYERWLECLIQAVGKHDPEFDEEIEGAWRAMMGFGIEFLTARY